MSALGGEPLPADRVRPGHPGLRVDRGRHHRLQRPGGPGPLRAGAQTEERTRPASSTTSATSRPSVSSSWPSRTRKVTRLTDNADFIQTWGITPDGRDGLDRPRPIPELRVEATRPCPKSSSPTWRPAKRKEMLAGRRIVPYGMRPVPDEVRLLSRGALFERPPLLHRLGHAPLLLRPRLRPRRQSRSRLGERAWRRVRDDPRRLHRPAGRRVALPPGPLRQVGERLDARADLEGDHVRNFWSFALSHDAKVVVYDHSTPGRPSQLFRASLDGNKLSAPGQLTDLNPGFKDKAVAI
ncbi:MAG: hypothetical protein M0C28_47735 [Candidatus Moduliflexus flocculans]|nr:hypothetical protein [Candidatus Moduliflexus flocculans]